MCNDYERYIEWKAFCAAMEAAGLGMPAGAEASQLKPIADTRVNDMAPVLRTQGNVVGLFPMRWGFLPGRPGGAPVFNFRSEGRSFAKSKRCLIPASAFFEFTGNGTPKSKWRFALADAAVLAIAGLWRESTADTPATFTMLTTAPGEDVAPFHDRQVAVLPQQDWANWLYLTKPEAELLKPLPAVSLRVSLEREGREPPNASLLQLIK